MKRYVIVSIIAASILGAGGCTNQRVSNADRPNAPSIYVESSAREVVAGEIVTLTARTKDTYGRSVRVRWSSTAGNVTPEQDGRIARVRFNEPGTYTVRASLMVDDREEQADMVEVRVRPVG
jgi:hypothetical protein